MNYKLVNHSSVSILNFAKDNLNEGDVLITLGAGNVCSIAYKQVELGK